MFIPNHPKNSFPCHKWLINGGDPNHVSKSWDDPPSRGYSSPITPKNSSGWCSTLTLLLICSSFSRENCHPLLICSSLSTAQSFFCQAAIHLANKLHFSPLRSHSPAHRRDIQRVQRVDQHCHRHLQLAGYKWMSTKNRGTWRIIPVSKWLVTPIYKPFRRFIWRIFLLNM